MKRIFFKFILSVAVIGSGFLIGHYCYALRWKCVDFVFAHHQFYGIFAQQLRDEMQKHGYMTQCPDILPKTKVYFIQTDYMERKPGVDESTALKIDFLGDCVRGDMPIDYLHKFDLLLICNKYQNGYLSTFNFRTAHFPLVEPYTKLCNTEFEDHVINIPLLATRLDEIIQGARHEKF